MSEQLLKAIEPYMHSEQDDIIDPMIKTSTLNLLTIREAVCGIENENIVHLNVQVLLVECFKIPSATVGAVAVPVFQCFLLHYQF